MCFGFGKIKPHKGVLEIWSSIKIIWGGSTEGLRDYVKPVFFQHISEFSSRRRILSKNTGIRCGFVLFFSPVSCCFHPVVQVSSHLKLPTQVYVTPACATDSCYSVKLTGDRERIHKGCRMVIALFYKSIFLSVGFPKR